VRESFEECILIFRIFEGIIPAQRFIDVKHNIFQIFKFYIASAIRVVLRPSILETAVNLLVQVLRSFISSHEITVENDSHK
jgi:hypothetical protein